MGSVLHLESFDAGGLAPAASRTVAKSIKTYEEGFADGQSQAAAAFSAENEVLRQSVVQSINDAALEHETAQANVMRAVMPLLDSMMSTLLPATLAPALHAHLRDMVEAALTIDAAAPIALTVPTDQLTAIADALGDLEHRNITIVGDSTLTAHAAWVTANGQETALDLDGALATIAEHVSSLFELSTAVTEVS